MGENINVFYQDLSDIINQLSIKAGMTKINAATLTDALVQADLRGISTHGVRCLPNYINRIERGSLNPNPNVKVVKENAITAVIDGDNGVGHIVGSISMEKAIEKAKETGVGITSVRNSNHFGMSAYFSMKALEHNFIGISMTNSYARLAPTGGVTPSYGNNPWSIAIPTNNIPVVVDMALSVVANSNIIMAKNKGEKIPFGWAATRDGEPTDDPSMAELLLPIAGYKGYAMATVVEVLTGILSGSSFGKNVNVSNSLEIEKGQDLGHFFMALDIEQFMPIDLFKERMAAFINDLKQSELATDVENIYLAGEKEYLGAEKRRNEGVSIHPYIVEEVNELCNKHNINGFQ